MRLVFLAILVALATSQCTEPSPYYQIDFFNIKSFRNANGFSHSFSFTKIRNFPNPKNSLETDTGAQKGTAFVDTTQRHIFYNFSVAGFSPDEVAASAWFFMAEEGSPGDTMACIPLAPGRCFCGIFPTMWYQPIVPKYAKRIDKRSVGDSFCWAYQYTVRPVSPPLTPSCFTLFRTATERDVWRKIRRRGRRD